MTQLPAVITAYLSASERKDIHGIVGCFDCRSVVHDDGKTYEGQLAIRAWREELVSTVEYTTEILDSDQESPFTFLVTTEVEGNFPGSPVQLSFRFELEGEVIRMLTIGS